MTFDMQFLFQNEEYKQYRFRGDHEERWPRLLEAQNREHNCTTLTIIHLSVHWLSDDAFKECFRFETVKIG